MGFKFAFLTDTHIQPEKGAVRGVEKALATLRARKPAFCLHGGDIVMDAAYVERGRAEALYDLWGRSAATLGVPIHYACGNHDVFALTGKELGRADTNKSFWQKRVGQSQRFKSFDHQGWRFVVLDVVQTAPEKWWGELDQEQLLWLDDLLRKTDRRQPLVFMAHIPLFTCIHQITNGSTEPTNATQIVKNAKTFFELIERHNTKAVFQGHTHVVEEISYHGARYITGGAVCGEWWKGPRLGRHPEGFIEAEVVRDELKWRYIPYGWDVGES